MGLGARDCGLWSVVYGEQGQTCAVLPAQVYMYQLFRSLAYIHSQGVCHRDIKPQNLLVDPDTAVLKLCDFGRWAGSGVCRVTERAKGGGPQTLSRIHLCPSLPTVQSSWSEGSPTFPTYALATTGPQSSSLELLIIPPPLVSHGVVEYPWGMTILAVSSFYFLFFLREVKIEFSFTGWAGPKPEAGDLGQVSHVGGRPQVLKLSLLLPRVHISKKPASKAGVECQTRQIWRGVS